MQIEFYILMQRSFTSYMCTLLFTPSQALSLPKETEDKSTCTNINICFISPLLGTKGLEKFFLILILFCFVFPFSHYPNSSPQLVFIGRRGSRRGKKNGLFFQLYKYVLCRYMYIKHIHIYLHSQT